MHLRKALVNYPIIGYPVVTAFTLLNNFIILMHGRLDLMKKAHTFPQKPI